MSIVEDKTKELAELYGKHKYGAIEALLRKDPGLFASLEGLLEEEDTDAQMSLLQLIGRVGFDYPVQTLPLRRVVISLMKSRDPFVRMDAAAVIATVFASDRSASEAALPDLRRLLKDWNSLVRGDAAQAVGNIGFYFPDLVAGDGGQLLEMLETEDDDEREAVAHALGKIGAMNPDLLKEIFPRLVKALEKTREASCGGILLAFGTVGLHFPEMVTKYVPRLIGYLQSSSEDTRRYAVLAIGNIATNRPDLVRDAAPHLERLGESPDHDLRVNARMALSMIGAAGN